MKHVFIILLAIAIIVTGIFLPYIPGEYDNFAFVLSYLFQFGNFASLLLVPIGLIWLTLHFTIGRTKPAGTYPFYLGKAALVMGTIILLAVVLGAYGSHSRFLSIIILCLGVLLFFLRKKTGRLFSIPDHILPYYFIFIPLTVLCLRMTFLEKVKNNSTDFVIKQCETLIQDIEAYKNTNGHYPLSLLSTIDDYKTYVSGIERFHYEPSGDAYNLYFEQFSDMIGTQEIVMYNKLDEHEMTVHNQDLLRLEPENIWRGYHNEADLPQPHWKIFYFD